ncbi:putative reverse transcriptase domain-containing protein [Tanacetum coccineum]
MPITIQSSVKDKILAAQSETSKEKNASAEMFVRTLIVDKAHASRYTVHPGADKTYYDLRDMYGGHKALGTRLDMSAAYHPQTDGQSKHTIQTSKDMLRACVINFGSNWDTHLPLAESPVLWAKIGENRLIRPELVQETTDKVVQIKEMLKAVRGRQKRYADNRRKPLEFSIGDQVLLKVSH